jgi:hypothetical protein
VSYEFDAYLHTPVFLGVRQTTSSWLLVVEPRQSVSVLYLPSITTEEVYHLSLANRGLKQTGVASTVRTYTVEGEARMRDNRHLPIVASRVWHQQHQYTVLYTTRVRFSPSATMAICPMS